MTNTHYIEQDFLYHQELAKFFSTLDRHHLSIKNWITDGPGGGNPCVTLTGTPENLLRCLVECNPGEDEEYLKTRIKQA